MNSKGLQRAAPLVLALVFVLAFFAEARAEVIFEDEPATVYAEPNSLNLKRPFWVAFQIEPKAGQYVPYVDPETGDRGLMADFALPEGFEKGQILQSVPSPLIGGTLYGYDKPFWVLQEIIPTYEAEFQETYAFPGQASWVECSVSECADHEQETSFTLPFGPGQEDLKNREIFRQARASLPDQMPWPATFTAGGGDFELIIHTPEAKRLEKAVLLVTQGRTSLVLNEFLEARVEEGKITFSGQPDDYLPRPALNALLLIQGPGGKAYILDVGNDFDTQPRTNALTPGLENFNIWMALGFAFLGGLILNLMPCVFPVLTLKIFGLVRAGAASARAMRVDGLAYTLGILMTFALLALIFLTIREAGFQVGWGFQLQSPYFVTALGLVLFLVTLNFAGLFEIRLPFAIETRGDREGALGSFYTGMLATVVATPCTAPFMTPALGFALTLPTVSALSVFLGLGLGMAAPYLLVAFVPKIQKVFPKPGRWMVVFKKILAIPLFLTVVWLGWVLYSQVGTPGIVVFMVFAGLLLGFLLLWKTLEGGPGAAKAMAGFVALTIFGAAFFITQPIFEKAVPKTFEEGGDVVKWSDEGVWNLRLQGKGVFVNYTANWCLTCLVNERLVLSREKFQRFLAENNIVYMEADWTNYDPEIGQSLEKLGRSALPVYVFFPPGGPTREPVFLPEILTLEETLEFISANK